MTKLVSLTEEAYQRLKSKKMEGESFSDLVLKMTGKVRLVDFAGTLTDIQAESLEKSIATIRKGYNSKLDSIAKELK